MFPEIKNDEYYHIKIDRYDHKMNAIVLIKYRSGDLIDYEIISGFEHYGQARRSVGNRDSLSLISISHHTYYLLPEEFVGPLSKQIIESLYL